MKLRIFLMLVMLSVLKVHATEYTLLNSIPFQQLRYFTTDPLGNTYVVAENQLLQFDNKGQPLANFSERGLGYLQSVDASNPLKILLFYPDFGVVLILNSKLAEQSRIQLRNIGLNQVTLVCSTLNEGYWVYDRQDFQLKKVDLNLQIRYQSDNLMNVTGLDVRPNFILESGQFVYLNDPVTGVLVFDRFGTYYKTIPLKGLRSFQLLENELIYVSEGKLMVYDLKTIQIREIILPVVESLINARIGQHQLFLLTSDALNFYSF